jgi:hypothetical protein
MAIDQYGQTYHGLEFPRKDLLIELNRQHAQKMYVGEHKHIGYVIAGLWLTIYKVIRIDKI